MVARHSFKIEMSDFLKYLAVLLICCQFSTQSTLRAQTMDYFYDPSFTPQNIVGGSSGTSVSSILAHEDGRYTVSGGFQFNWPFQIKKIVRLYIDGSLDESFSLQGNPVSVSYMQFFQEGYLIWVPNTVAFIEGNGDYSTFQFLDISYSPYQPVVPPSSTAGMYRVLEDNKIMVAGRFSPDTTNLEDRRHLVRVMPDGSPDTSFEPLKCHEPYDARIIDLYPTPDGKWMIAGEFMDIEGYESPGIARLNEDFSVDTTFQSPFPGLIWSVRIVQGAHPQDMSGAIDDQGRVYIIHKDSATGFDYSKNARLLPNGDVDTTFNAPEMVRYFISGNSAPGLIFSMAFEPDGSLIVGGSFRKMDEQTRNGIAKLNEDGSLIENVFNRQGADTANWQNGENPDINMPSIHTIVRLDNGSLMVGGLFSRYDGHNQWGVVRLLPSPVGIGEHFVSNSLTLSCFPNPASETIQVEIPERWQHHSGSIQLHNSTGQLVYEQSAVLTSHEQITVEEFPRGMYLLSIESGQERGMAKVVVE